MVAIKVEQTGKPAGVVGQAREDLSLGTPVLLTAVGGPYLSQQWRILDRPVDYMAGTQSVAAFTNPNALITQLNPIDKAGTYRVGVAVDAGFGLGARPEDNAVITFYAGPPLAAAPNQFPRRIPAFGERTEHNAPDLIFPGGNPRGWAQELGRWLLATMSISGGGGGTDITSAVRYDAPTTTIVAAKNVASVTPVAGLIGVYDVLFSISYGAADYIPVPTAVDLPGGSCTVINMGVDGFRVIRADAAGVVVDAPFSVLVFGGTPL